jgi:hypothetical protein
MRTPAAHRDTSITEDQGTCVSREFTAQCVANMHLLFALLFVRHMAPTWYRDQTLSAGEHFAAGVMQWCLALACCVIRTSLYAIFMSCCICFVLSNLTVEKPFFSSFVVSHVCCSLSKSHNLLLLRMMHVAWLLI